MQTRFHTAFSTLSPSLQTALRPYLAADDFAAMFSAAQITEIKKTSGLDDNALAFALLPVAAACATAPISNFFVGAVARGQSGNWYLGANQEFAGVPLHQSIHAEQCAINHAWLRGESALVAVTVNYSPCGHCRQFMNELNTGTALEIHLPGRATATLADYLPDSFGPQDLNISTLLLDHVQHGHALSTSDALSAAALAAANQSHAPYSQAHSGVALEDQHGNIFTGRYAENAAFNPSLPPLQSALIMMILANGDIHQIRRAILAEPAEANIRQWANVQATLSALGCNNVNQITF